MAIANISCADTCDSTANCGTVQDCYFYCRKKTKFQGGILNAQNASNLIVSSSADECMKQATVNLPNNGNASFTMTAQKSFKEITVNAGPNTQNIFIDCSFGNGDECKTMQMNAESAQYLEIRVDGVGSELNEFAVVNCPRHSSYQGPEIAPCIIDVLNGGKLVDVTIHTLFGMPQDVWIKTDDRFTNTLNNVVITCNNQTGSSLNLGDTFFQQGDCWLTPAPTMEPTVPTLEPTTTTTTASPTTANPTLNPTTGTPTQSTLNPTSSTDGPTTTATTAEPTTSTMDTTGAPTIYLDTTSFPDLETTEMLETIITSTDTTSSTNTASVSTTTSLPSWTSTTGFNTESGEQFLDVSDASLAFSTQGLHRVLIIFACALVVACIGMFVFVKHKKRRDRILNDLIHEAFKGHYSNKMSVNDINFHAEQRQKHDQDLYSERDETSAIAMEVYSDAHSNRSRIHLHPEVVSEGLPQDTSHIALPTGSSMLSMDLESTRRESMQTVQVNSDRHDSIDYEQVEERQPDGQTRFVHARSASQEEMYGPPSGMDAARDSKGGYMD